MTANVCYQIMQYCVAKGINQGFLSPQDFYTVINTAQSQYLDYLLGEYQKYQVRRPIAVVEVGQNMRIKDSLIPLIYNAVLPINSTTGIAAFPSDYEYPDQMWSIYGNYNIKFVEQTRVQNYRYSDIDPIAENPVFILQHEGFHFFPERPYGENQASLSYYRKPPSIVWGYVLDSNGVPVYNPATSQDPVWGETDCLQIIVRALRMVGVSLDFNTVSQYAEMVKNGGQ